MYVAISKVLEKAILDCVTKIEEAELAAVTEPFKHDPKAQWMVDYVERALWGEHLALKNQLPKTWFASMDRPMTIRVIFPDGGASVLFFESTGMFDVPPGTYGYTIAASTKWDVPLAAVPAELHERLLARHKVRLEVRKKYEKLRGQLKQLLGACKSLNEAVTRFPDLRLFVPAEYIERLDRKPPPRARAGEAPEKCEVDAELLASIGVVGKLHGV